jgi:hypothetical protein
MKTQRCLGKRCSFYYCRATPALGTRFRLARIFVWRNKMAKREHATFLRVCWVVDAFGVTAMTMNPTTPRAQGVSDAPRSEDARTIMINEISWGAVFAGVAVALVMQILLNLLGVGLGAATLNPVSGDNPSATSFSIGAGIWWAVSGAIAALAGGFVAGRLSGKPVKSTAGWHGVISWAMSTILIIYMLTSAVGGIVGGVYSGISGAVGGIGKTATAAAQTAAPGLAQASDPFGSIERSIRDATGGNDPAALRDASVSALRAAVSGDPAQQRDAKERAAQALSKAQNVSIDEARTRVDQYEAQYRQTMEETKRQAAQAAEVTAKAVSRGSLVAVIALALGGIAAWFGGRLGAVDPTLTSGYQRNRVG